MGMLVVRDPFRTVSSVLPELTRLQRGAVANARAAVDRDRRAAAERARVEAARDPFALLPVLTDVPVTVSADDFVA